MDIKINIERNGEFGIVVRGLEKEEAYRKSALPRTFGDYSWEDSITIDFLHAIDSEGEEKLVEYKINTHCEDGSCMDNLFFHLNKDGLIKITRIVIPNKKWMDAMTGDAGLIPMEEVKQAFYFDRYEGNIPLFFTKGSIKGAVSVDIMDIYDSSPSSKNTAFKTDVFVFTTAYVDRCYNLLIKDLLKCVRRSGECPNAEILAKERNRDIINMFITSMKYAREMDKFFEAQRLLEQLDSCNMICNSANITPFIRPNDCGC